MAYQVGTLLNINGLEGKVIGYIQYENTQDPGKEWVEYRLWTPKGECWLSCDDFYKEYSISWPDNSVRGRLGPEWHKVDEGFQVVRKYGGDVDVDPGESANFIEFEDEAEEHILSVETWSDGTEFSRGEYIEPENIQITGFEQPGEKSKSGALVGLVVSLFILIFLGSFFAGAFKSAIGGSKSISKYLESSTQYTYETSVTGNQEQKATVYAYEIPALTDTVAMDIIEGIDGDTESVTQKDNTSNEEIAILTKKEYCLVYHPENKTDVVYVQVSDRKYNYTSDNSPYRSSKADTIWYRSHYYSSGYSSDAKSYKSMPSAYSMYSGDTIHNIGNGYFDSYSSSIRQSSVNNRDSSSGGISSGK